MFRNAGFESYLTNNEPRAQRRGDGAGPRGKARGEAPTASQGGPQTQAAFPEFHLSKRNKSPCSTKARAFAQIPPWESLGGKRRCAPFYPDIILNFLPVNEVFWIHYFEAFPFVSQFQFQSCISGCANSVCSCFFLHFHSAARKPEKESLQLSKQKVSLISIYNNYNNGN